MIESVQFKNFKVLRDATLPLGRFTLIVGPNGSGKSTALQALSVAAFPVAVEFDKIVSARPLLNGTEVEIVVRRRNPRPDELKRIWRRGQAWAPSQKRRFLEDGVVPSLSLEQELQRSRVYSFDPQSMVNPVSLEPNMRLDFKGGNLTGILDQMQDHDPERFELLNEELKRWFPEFERVLFDTPSTGAKIFFLRARQGRYKIPAGNLSQGTLLALALLTLAYLPEPPTIVGLEEPDRGIHPRLLRRIQDALYRLSYPENFGEKREPVQVIATTHSPYFLDLYKDHPEEIVIAQKTEDGARFERLSDHPDIEEILEDAPLGDVWFSGILGGVPAEQ